MYSFLYIIKSKKDGSYYVGSSCNPDQRLIQYNNGQVKSTKGKIPYQIVFKQRFQDNKEARKAEMKVKSWKRRDYIKKVIDNNIFILGA